MRPQRPFPLRSGALTVHHPYAVAITNDGLSHKVCYENRAIPSKDEFEMYIACWIQWPGARTLREKGTVTCLECLAAAV